MAQLSTPRLGQFEPDPVFFTQDRQGRFWAFRWDTGEKYGFDCAKVVAGQQVWEVTNPERYDTHVQQVFQHKLPTQCQTQVLTSRYRLQLHISLNPVVDPTGRVIAVSGVGHVLGATPLETTITEEPAKPAATPINPFPGITDQLMRSIRQTLDVKELLQQAVDQLGSLFEVNRCVMGLYNVGHPTFTIAAEYRSQPNYPSLLNKTLSLSEHPIFLQALKQDEPLFLDRSLTLTTSYQGYANSIISLEILDPGDHQPTWNTDHLAVLQSISTYLGTVIAHGVLLDQSRQLATRLQLTNRTLVQKNKELQQAREQAESANRLKSQFLANTSHELRTPLNGMIGFIKLLLDGMADSEEEAQDFLQEAYRSALHLLALINDVLDIAKIEAGKMQLDCVPCDLATLFEDVSSKTQLQAQQKRLQLSFQLPETHDHVLLLGDYQRLLQVLLNLVGNALKFTHEGSVTITADVINGFPNRCKIRVADTGIGVSLEKQQRLFQVFSQVDGSTTRQYGGTGLGLAISQRLVEAMDGEMNFYSLGEGLGSTVTFTVPLYRKPLMGAANDVETQLTPSSPAESA
ncbi:MAG: histidine kinase [Synechococcaceae cyanobacterium SM2_3_2]|nr:histidine kinase [Synechococcaceae cyanobacterium SM2_3_2]